VTTTKPYLVRAIHEWAMDNQFTPQILVTDAVSGVVVPKNHVKDGHIVFNVHMNAVKDLHMGNETIRFSARFSGKPVDIEVPVEAVLAIYARENGQGIFFQDNEQTPPPEDTVIKSSISDTPDKTSQSSPKGHLKLVK
jgi:stringent starvation protein B